MTLEAVKDQEQQEEQKAPEQTPLFVTERPTFEYARVEIHEILEDRWGAPPDDRLRRNVEMTGPLFPIIVKRAEQEGYRILEGRRRFQSAVAAGDEDVHVLIVSNDDLGMAEYVLSLSGNSFNSSNAIVDLQALQELQVRTGERDPVELARRARIPLSIVKKRLRLQSLMGELQDAWLDGKFSNAVGEAAAKLEQEQQRKLLKVLRETDALTIEDVREAKRTDVRSHQRTLPGQRVKDRAAEGIRKIKNDVFLQYGDCSVTELLSKALSALDELEDE